MSKRTRKKKPGEREANGRLVRAKGRPAQQQPATPRRDAERALRQSLMTRAMQMGLIEMRPVPTEKAFLQMGLNDPKAIIDAMKEPWMSGTYAGQAIAFEKDAADLWGLIKMIQGRRAAWLRSIGGPRDVAKTASIQTEPDDRGEVFGDLPPADIRTDEEKARDAERRWHEISDAMRTANPLLQRCVVLDERVDGDIAGWLRKVKKAIG